MSRSEGFGTTNSRRNRLALCVPAQLVKKTCQMYMHQRLAATERCRIDALSGSLAAGLAAVKARIVETGPLLAREIGRGAASGAIVPQQMNEWRPEGE